MIKAKRVTIFRYPKLFFEFWYKMHKACYEYCGNWFGCILLPWGKFVVLNDEFSEFIDSKMKKEQKNER